MPEMLIGGEWCAARSGEELDILDPATEDTVATVPSGSPEDVDAAVAAALAAFPAWSAMRTTQIGTQRRSVRSARLVAICSSSALPINSSSGDDQAVVMTRTP